MSSRERFTLYYKTFIISLLLLIWGSAMVLSSSAPFAYQYTNNSYAYFIRHSIFFLPGTAIFLFLKNFPYQRLQRLAKPLVIFSLILLALTLIFGKEVKGAKRALEIGIFRFQPSELAKISLIIYLSDFLARNRGKIIPRNLFPPLIIGGLMMVLLIKEPDFGSTILCFAYMIGIFFLGGLSIRLLLASMIPAIAAAGALVVMEPYRFKRIIAFLHPERDPQGIGYQVIQSLITIGSGGLFGVGLGKGRQKLSILPEAYKDYVFAVVGEESGFVGAVFLLFLFMFLVWNAFVVSKKVKDLFGRFLASGIGMYFAFQVILHSGVAVKILPPKGTTLPFFSYGGSSLVAGMAMLGIFLNIIGSLREEESPMLSPELA
jgi:cell division protein FtsW